MRIFEARRTIVKLVLRGIDHNRVPGQARDRATIGWPEGRPSGSERVKGWKRERSECGSESKSEKG
jgi:hypothetical protein